MQTVERDLSCFIKQMGNKETSSVSEQKAEVVKVGMNLLLKQFEGNVRVTAYVANALDLYHAALIEASIQQLISANTILCNPPTRGDIGEFVQALEYLGMSHGSTVIGHPIGHIRVDNIDRNHTLLITAMDRLSSFCFN